MPRRVVPGASGIPSPELHLLTSTFFVSIFSPLFFPWAGFVHLIGSYGPLLRACPQQFPTMAPLSPPKPLAMSEFGPESCPVLNCPDDHSRPQGLQSGAVMTISGDDVTNQPHGTDPRLGQGGRYYGSDIEQLCRFQHNLAHHTFGYRVINSKRNLFLVYILMIFVYIGINIALFGANFKSQDFIEEHYYLGLHAVEFWAVFVFAAIEGMVLVSTNNLPTVYHMGLIFFNITFSFATALLFQLYPEEYEGMFFSILVWFFLN